MQLPPLKPPCLVTKLDVTGPRVKEEGKERERLLSGGYMGGRPPPSPSHIDQNYIAGRAWLRKAVCLRNRALYLNP